MEHKVEAGCWFGWKHGGFYVCCNPLCLLAVDAAPCVGLCKGDEGLCSFDQATRKQFRERGH